MAFVESLSWMNSGSVGTSNDIRSALPAQFRKGVVMPLSSPMAFCAAAIWPAASFVSGLPLSFFRASASSASALAMRASPRSRAGCVLSVPLQDRRQRIVVEVLLRRQLFLELRLRPDLWPHWALSFGMLVVFGGLAANRGAAISATSHL